MFRYPSPSLACSRPRHAVGTVLAITVGSLWLTACEPLRVVGQVEAADRLPTAAVRVRGWAGARHNSATVSVRLAVNGHEVAVVAADRHRPDIAASEPGLSNQVGFEVVLPPLAGPENGVAGTGTPLTGELCVVANHPAGVTLDLGCQLIPGGTTDQGVIVPDGERVDWHTPVTRTRDGAASYHSAAFDPLCAAPNGPTAHPPAPTPTTEYRCLAWYRPGPGRYPTLMWLPGGGWTGGAAEPPPQPILDLVDRGWTVVAVQYRLSGCTFNHFPGAVHDAQDALAFLRSDPDRFGVDPARILIAGHSAGGNLAGMVATVWNDTSGLFRSGVAVRPTGWVSLSGVEDMHQFLGASVWPHALWPYLPYTPYPPPTCFWAPPGWVPQAWAVTAASPVTHLDAADPPAFLVRGGSDIVCPAGNVLTSIGERYAGAGRPTGLWQQVVPNGDHFMGWNRDWLWGFLDQLAVNPTVDPAPPASP